MWTPVLKIGLFSAVLSLYQADAQVVHYMPCKISTYGGVTKLVIEPCPSLPCQLKRGTNVTATAYILNTSEYTARKCTTVVHGIIGKVSVPFHTPYTDACKTTGIQCPIHPAAPDIYKVKMEVKKSYPQVKRLTVKWGMKDQENRDFFCFEVPVSIV